MRTRYNTAVFAIVQLCMLGNAAAEHQLHHAHLHLDRRQAIPVEKGCYSSPGGSASTNGVGTYNYQSSSWCANHCFLMGKPVSSLTGGLVCYCADLLPSEDDAVDPTQCNVPCAGYPQEACGGTTAYSVYLTGKDNTVGSVSNSPGNQLQNQGAVNGDPSSAPASTVFVQPTVQATTVIQDQQTIVQTIAASSSPPSNAQNQDVITSSNNGHSTGSTIGIAVGVVAGILVFTAIILFVVFYLRRRRRMKNAENGHARADSLNAFVAGGSTHNIPAPPPVAQNDSRLDPRLMVERRRMSAGSVFADNEDYSRRILKVANPDE